MATIDYQSSPFDEAISFLEGRIALPSERWNDFSDSEANAAFWSAGAVDANLVSDLQKSVTRAIQNGVPYDSPEFAAQIANFSEQYGWDIKGGADWRARLILSQNLRQSYAAGRHDQQFDPDVMKLQPYLQYLHSSTPLDRARPAHVALDGKVFRKNDPIVSSIYPPNGFNCGCTMIALSQRQLDRKGLEVESIKLGETLPYVDSNGQTKQAIIKPDDGFNAAPSSNAEQRIINLARIKERLPQTWGERIDSAIASLQKESSQKATVQIRELDLKNSRSTLINNFGEELIRKAESNIQKIINDNDVMVRVSSANIEAIISDGKMSNAAQLKEKGIILRGENYVNTRNDYEERTLGIPLNTPASDRPIYGYAGNTSNMKAPHQSNVGFFGDVAFKLKPDVKDRVSLSVNDSFNGQLSSKATEFNAGSFAEGEKSEYGKGDSERLVKGASESKSIDDYIQKSGSQYLEYQIQGGVKTSDIAEMHYMYGKQPSEKTIQWAKENGVPIFTYAKS